jgi:DMSO/TMAO reductase YedYZ molybdopterin-dependent catalytic subunit
MNETPNLNPHAGADSTGRVLSEAEFKARSRRSFLTGLGGIAAAGLGWRWVQGRPESDNIPDVLRSAHELNEDIWRGLFREGAMAPTFDFEESSMLRVNGRHGIREELDMDTWQLTVLDVDGTELGVHSLEGWSHVVAWGGPTFATFLDTWYPEKANHEFVGLSTPDGDFNVGLEMPAMLHPQTLLALDLQREPLSDEHGAPVRLSTPLKYGTKNIKRIGTIQFSDTRPENDYWTVRGYDWYAAL